MRVVRRVYTLILDLNIIIIIAVELECKYSMKTVCCCCCSVVGTSSCAARVRFEPSTLPSISSYPSFQLHNPINAQHTDHGLNHNDAFNFLQAQQMHTSQQNI